MCRPRFQYATESHGNGSPAPPAERSPPPRGLPSDPRPAHKVPAGLRPGSSSSIDARSPSPSAAHTRDEDAPPYSMPVPDTSSSSLGSYGQPWNLSPAASYFSNGTQSPGSMLQKKTSFRPPGASAPRVPGHAIGLDSHDEESTFSPSSELYSPMSTGSGTYFPLDATYASNLPSFSNIPPPPPLNPPVHPQTPPRPGNALERDSSEDILAPGTQGFARPLSHSKFLILFPGICRTNETIVLRLQLPAALSQLSRVRSRAGLSVT